MSQPVLRSIDGRLFHWCPACERLHPLPSDTGKWAFDGNMERPTFSPSFKHYLNGDKGAFRQIVSDKNGRQVICHYILTAGVLNFCSDCTHAMAGQAVPLPPIPDGELP